MVSAIKFENVDILFPGSEGQGARSRVEAALQDLDSGKTRADIHAAHGVTVGSSGVNLEIEQGKIFVIMGLSGSGKTTLLRAVNGLNKISRGRVLVRQGDQAVDVGAAGAKALRRIRNEAFPWFSSNSHCCRGGRYAKTWNSASNSGACRRMKSARPSIMARYRRAAAMGGKIRQGTFRRHAATCGAGARAGDECGYPAYG